jgi:hypothetical protein
LTLFNVRLGAWLGNPGPAGDTSYRDSAPRNGTQSLLAEALGLADDSRPYVYLSDGGHFENLGAYEMVRRRCRFILVVDADADSKCSFEDLANAARRIRIDFGIPITFKDKFTIVSRDASVEDKKAARYCAVGKIHYDQVDEGGEPGYLVYIKPAYYEQKEPIDVRGYAGESSAFPHETTADQFFTEAQFESYRALGAHIFDAIQCEKSDVDPFDITPAQSFQEFFDRVRTCLALASAPKPAS